MVSQSTEMATISNNGGGPGGNNILKMVQAANRVTPLWDKINRSSHIAARKSNFLLNNTKQQKQAARITEVLSPKDDLQLKRNNAINGDVKKNRTVCAKDELVVYWNDKKQGTNEIDNINNNNINESTDDIHGKCSKSLHESWPYQQCGLKEKTEDILIDDSMITDDDSMCEQSHSCFASKRELNHHHLKPVNIVRRNSSTDSGIVVTMPNERRNPKIRGDTYDDVKRVEKPFRSNSAATRKETTDNQNQTCCRSNSFPFSTHCKDQLDPRERYSNCCKNTGMAQPKQRNEKLFDISNFMQRGNKKQNTPTRLLNKHVDEDFRHVTMSCDVNNTNNEGNTCLHHASSMGDVETTKFLLRNGGNVWLRNKHDDLPLDVCADFNTAKVLSEATLFYTDNKSHRKDCNISSTFQIAFDL